MTTISRQDLQNMYKEHVEAEKIRIAKLLEDELNSILKEILQLNNVGLKRYSKNYMDYPGEFINVIVYKLKEIFIDSNIGFEESPDNSNNKLVTIFVDWTI